MSQEPLLRRPLRLSNKKTGVECSKLLQTSQRGLVIQSPTDRYESGEGLEPETGSGIGPDHRIERLDGSKGRPTCSGLRDCYPILQVASANRLIVGAALASPRRSIKFFIDESCSSLTFFRLFTQEAPPEIPKSVTPFSMTRLHTRASLRHCTFFELSSLDPEMQPSATSPYVVVYFRQNPAPFGKSGSWDTHKAKKVSFGTFSPFPALSNTVTNSALKISLPTPTTTYNFNDYLAVLSTKSVFEMAYYKSTAHNPFGGLQAFLNDHRVLFSPSTLKTYHKKDLISLATRVKDIFGLVDAWTVNSNNELPLVIDRARLTVFRNLRGTYKPSIFNEDMELRSWVQEEEEKALDQGLAQLVSLAKCKFGRLETPFLTTMIRPTKTPK
ncbi:hypothetical protein K435DRAFT_810898 [Dendrothele bispora CBS 962.96]|uniref:Uncharacterized protein n=1 Tax=Dendrothele bispora (strain CBS 962.96) TaxID=1314807 RepID=A0A4S8KTY4_DENBC|nr:hypothetical protein K435DRAFT_810898 [Dendrothele bispora CBS 962.96]